ncbi:uncharacterized protein DUF4179 [Paenibacillus cellulosilyticus]|uniref:Uncharacterized protein DUF4179 n=1 Tax=Paenibacillus cellulosilyticus TaxID=375489 RepID=A0A2V2Z135_9BACL|nr:DUF4179 domain-containing protein [Paenibacillus cellulosilyticus]PWW07251.1 uncharacterized protein DUF4179 [Paenibacillus cellulosilyticus]QKS44559.1 DUF4179 domain-containing protein [Paenibacillus cellulosilyticus]
MAAFELEKEFDKLDTSNMEMSPLVRSRLDETYALLSEQAQQAPRINRRKSSKLRRLALTTAAAGILAAGLFTTAAVSPAMASSLKSIPVIGSIFSKIQGDIGLRIAGELGLTTTVNRTVSYEDVSLQVTETLYDGNRAAFVLNVTAPNLDNGTYNNGNKKMRLDQAINNIYVTIDGKQQNGNIYYGSAGEDYPNTLVFELVADPTAAPDSFNAAATITLEGIDHEFTVDIPFKKTTDTTVELSPDTLTSSKDLSFSVSKVSVTPITTRLTTSIALTDAITLTNKEEHRLIAIGVAVFDDQGRHLSALNGEGIMEGNRLLFDRRFASQPGTSKYLIVKPFIIRDSFNEDVQEDQFIQQLETIIELPAAN